MNINISVIISQNNSTLIPNHIMSFNQQFHIFFIKNIIKYILNQQLLDFMNPFIPYVGNQKDTNHTARIPSEADFKKNKV